MTCLSPLVGIPPSADYKMDLCDVTLLADVMALSIDVNDTGGGPGGANGYGKYWCAETAGRRMINAAGLTLVNDVTAANGTNYLRLGSAPNGGEAGYSWQNITALWPADTYKNFWCRFILRTPEGGLCFEGDCGLITPNNFHGLAFYRDPVTNCIMPLSYMGVESTGDYTTALTAAVVADTDLVQIDMHWRLFNPANISRGRHIRYDVAIDVIVKVNGIANPIRHLTGKVDASRFEQDAAKGLAPWQLQFQTQNYGDNSMEVHGWEFEVGGVSQLAGVTAYTQTFANGTLRTNVELGGQPKGGYKRWRPLGQKPYPKLPGSLPIEPPPVEGGIAIRSLSEVTTIAAAAFTDTTIQLPAGRTILSVDVRVITTIPTATSFSVGDSGNATRFNTANVGVAAGSTDPGTKAGAYYNAAALSVRLTMNGGTPATNAGRVRVTINYVTSA